LLLIYKGGNGLLTDGKISIKKKTRRRRKGVRRTVRKEGGILGKREPIMRARTHTET